VFVCVLVCLFVFFPFCVAWRFIVFAVVVVVGVVAVVVVIVVAAVAAVAVAAAVACVCVCVCVWPDAIWDPVCHQSPEQLRMNLQR
jgi:hypothetical protein